MHVNRHDHPRTQVPSVCGPETATHGVLRHNVFPDLNKLMPHAAWSDQSDAICLNVAVHLPRQEVGGLGGQGHLGGVSVGGRMLNILP